jgi:hypothetical protein
MIILRVFRWFWKDAVFSKIISVALIGAFWYVWDKGEKTPQPPELPKLAIPAELTVSVPTIGSGLGGGSQAGVSNHFTEAMLRNLTYPIQGQLVALRDGKREYVPKDLPGEVNEDGPIYASLAHFVIGDLNGDGEDDAVVFLNVSGGGSGHFLYMVPVINDHGIPQVANKAYLIGDRVQPESVELANRTVTLKVVMRGPDDPYCCPTDLRTLRFTLRGGLLNCGENGCAIMHPEKAV